MSFVSPKSIHLQLKKINLKKQRLKINYIDHAHRVWTSIFIHSLHAQSELGLDIIVIKCSLNKLCP